MAKGLRATVNKRNKTKLRADVFGPVEEARNERLSAKLMELVAQPKPERPEMDVVGEEAKDEEVPIEQQSEAMEVDGAKSTPRPPKRKSGRIQKKKYTKNSTTFKSVDKRAARRKAIAKSKAKK